MGRIWIDGKQEEVISAHPFNWNAKCESQEEQISIMLILNQNQQGTTWENFNVNELEKNLLMISAYCKSP